MRFDADYQEDLTLEGGLPVRVRCIRPEDKAQMLEGFDRLGPESRYLRFFSGKTELTPADLAYLTEVDGVDHVALVVGEVKPDGSERGLGVARFVRDPKEPTVAEPAIAIADDAQGQGLGTLLLKRLTEAAVERDIDRFRCPILSNNEAVQHLLAEIQPEIHRQAEGSGITLLEIVLPQSVAPEGSPLAAHAAESSGKRPLRTALQRLLASVARQAVQVPHRWRAQIAAAEAEGMAPVEGDSAQDDARQDDAP